MRERKGEEQKGVGESWVKAFIGEGESVSVHVRESSSKRRKSVRER